jgi:putative copper resistance protein D
MSMDWGSWELAQVLVKIAVYACMAAATGGMLVLCLLQRAVTAVEAQSSTTLPPQWFLQQRHALLHHIALASAEGLLATVLLFLLQVGSVNEADLAGMFDPLIIRILAATPVGVGMACKFAGFALTLVAVLTVVSKGSRDSASALPHWLLAVSCLTLLLFAASFAVLGHTAVLGLPVRLATGVHVAAVLLWIGALLPLRRLNAAGPLVVVQPLLRSFGVLGWVLVGALLLAGGVLLFNLLEDPATLLTTTYGLLLLGKLLMAGCLLALAALNKFRLVPALTEQTRAPLQISIGFELLLALTIIVLTAMLTTLTGAFQPDGVH